jgi:hypothetical protein
MYLFEILVRVAYLQKFWYVLSPCRSMVLANYLQNFDERRYLQKLVRAAYLQIYDTPCLSAALHVPAICHLLKFMINASVTLEFNF